MCGMSICVICGKYHNTSCSCGKCCSIDCSYIFRKIEKLKDQQYTPIANETFMPIPDHPNFFASNLGNICFGFRGTYYKLNQRLIRCKNGESIYRVTLRVCNDNTRRNSFEVARLVLLAFCPDHEEDEICNHKDGNLLNNNIDNLEWKRKGYRNGYTQKNSLSPDRKRRKARKIINTTNNMIYDSVYDAEHDTGIPHGSLYKCLNGKQKYAGGCKWKYYDY